MKIYYYIVLKVRNLKWVLNQMSTGLVPSRGSGVNLFHTCPAAGGCLHSLIVALSQQSHHPDLCFHHLPSQTPTPLPPS